MKLKLSGLIIGMCFIFAVGVYYADEINAQEKTYEVGDKGPAGGWIFYDKGDSDGGWRYLEAAPKDQGKAKWGCKGNSIPGAKEVAVGTGKRNTQAILKGCADKNSAAKLASSYRGGGKSDWFLPSKDELNLMHEKLHRKGVGGFKEEGYYWSSSEESEVSSWYQGFRKGNQSNYHKDFKRCVRAVRSF